MPQEEVASNKKGIRWGWIVAGLLAIFLVVAFSMKAMDDVVSYYVTADEYVKNQSQYAGKKMKVAGLVKAGSLKVDKSRYEFTVEYHGAEFPVAYVGMAPDTFKEGVEVVVEGRGVLNGDFQASVVMAKCASKYKVGGLPPLDQRPDSP